MKIEDSPYMGIGDDFHGDLCCEPADLSSMRAFIEDDKMVIEAGAQQEEKLRKWYDELYRKCPEASTEIIIRW